MAYAAQSQGPWLKGLFASNQPLTQPKGSFPRGSNLVLMERGALTPCDGSGIINAFGGTSPSNQGKFLDIFLFEPTGVTPYYLALQRAPAHLGAPAGLVATLAAGGSLTSGTTYYYVVTSIDGTGGESVASSEVSATPSAGNLSVKLTWNTVPNAFGYNIYRSTSPGAEIKLVAAGLPVLQPSTATTTFTDTGIVSFTTLTFTNVSAVGSTSGGQNYIQFTLAGSQTFPSGSIIGLPLTATLFVPTGFNGSWTVFSQPAPNSVIVQGGPGSGSTAGSNISIGPFNAGSGSSFTVINVAWSNPNNVTNGGGGSFAIANVTPSNPTTNFLGAANFSGFSAIPIGAAILGIQMDIHRKVAPAGAGLVQDVGVFLTKAGVITGSDHSSGTPWPTTAAWVPYGGPTDLWGAAWTDTDIKNSGFGGGTTAEYFGSLLKSINPAVDGIRITVWYSSGTGGTLVLSNTSAVSNPPTIDTTTQTVLFKMPNSGGLPIPYSFANAVAYYPSAEVSLGTPPSGGSGGSGTTGPGTLTNSTSSTPSGGIIGLVGPLPQFKQFTNRVIIALGNGFPMQIYWDPTGTAVNPAPTGTIASVVKTGDLVTVTVSGVTLNATNPNAVAPDQFFPVGANVVLSNMSDPTYNGAFVVISVPSATTFVIRNPLASGGPSTGTFTISTTPITPADENFIPAYPVWTASTAYAVGDIIVPATQPPKPIYVTVLQAGTSGSSEPGWNTPQPTIGEQFKDNNIIWTVTALLNSAAPPPPGAGHIEIYAGSLWVFNTWPINTANGLDGPTSLRMSNLNNPFGWNPVNQAFLDKDDGAEGMGLGKFTITAQGIPPEGSLIAFKYRVPYQLIGVFGANNFAIQPVSSDMGCLAPRSIQFIAGNGLVRYTHLGIATFDGWRDQVISEQIRPFIFPVNDFDVQDIVVADANYLPLSWGAQTANPPMYTFAMPIGNSGGQLTRIMLYDLILKCWAAPVDLPFPIGCMVQVQPVTSNPLTIIGGFNDGCLQRWQAGDVLWYTGGGAAQMEVAWSVRTSTMASQNSSQRLWARKLVIRGTGSNVDTDPAIVMNVQIRQSGIVKSSINYTASNQGDFDIFADIGLTGLRFDAVISGTDHLELDGWDWAVEPRPFGVPVQAV
jgi:hypothetical protein